MMALQVSLPFIENWYDVVVAVAMIYGVGSGVRSGLRGELIGLIGLALMIWLSLSYYDVAGAWLQRTTPLPVETANLVAFIALALVTLVITLALQALSRRHMRKVNFPSWAENIGGGIAGSFRMFVVMACLTVLLCLLRSEFWHEQVGRQSRFGSFIIPHLPAVAAMLHKQYPEKLWFMEELHRRADPDVEQPPVR